MSRAKEIRQKHRRSKITDYLQSRYPNKCGVVEIAENVPFSKSQTRKMLKRMWRRDMIDGSKNGGIWAFRAWKPASTEPSETEVAGESGKDAASSSKRNEDTEPDCYEGRSVLEKVRGDIEAVEAANTNTSSETARGVDS